MLVLTRKKSEEIRIGDDIVIKVIKTGQSSVKIGIDAPENVRVLRAELCDETPAVPRKSAMLLGSDNRSRFVANSVDPFPNVV